MSSGSLNSNQVLNDCDYTREGITLWINNKPKDAIVHLEKRKSSLNVCHGYILLNFVNAVISFETDKIEEVKQMIKDLESRTTRDLGWIRSLIKSRLFGNSNANEKPLIETLEEQIILADTQLCSAILEGLSQDIPGIIKAGWLLRKAWKVYETTYRQIYQLYSKALNCDPLCQEPIRFAVQKNGTNSSFQGSDEWTVPNSLAETPVDTEKSFVELVKSKSCHFPSSSSQSSSLSQEQLASSWFKNLTSTKRTSSSVCILSENCENSCENDNHHPSRNNATDFTNIDFSNQYNIDAIQRLLGAVNFGYGIFQLCLSLLPPNILKFINFFGFQGDQRGGINCLKLSQKSTDWRSPIATISLLWYYTIVTPFFSLEGTNLDHEINEATDLINLNHEKYGKSALYLFFRGRVERLRKNIKNAVIAYEYSYRVAIQREIRLLCLHEVGWCCMIDMNYQSARNYFSELKKASKFSRSFYAYLSVVCAGADGFYDSEMRNEILTLVSKSSQKEGLIEKFIYRRCSLVLPDESKLLDEEQKKVFFQLLVYELLYLWNTLSSSSLQNLNIIIDNCKLMSEKYLHIEPIIGLTSLLSAACYSQLKLIEPAINLLRQCVSYCDSHSDTVVLEHIPVFAKYELALLLLKKSQNDIETQNECKQLLISTQIYKNYDFESRLSLRIHSLLRSL